LKQAYVTLILPFYAKVPSIQEIAAIDSALKLSTRDHEIILVTMFDMGVRNFEVSGLSGPVSVVYTNSISTQNSSRIAAIGRAVGDFVIEWQGTIDSLTKEMILELLEPTNNGLELIEFESAFQPRLSRKFYKFTNTLRPSRIPVRKAVGRAFSRRALGQLLLGASFEPQLNVLFAELPIPKTSKTVHVDFAEKQNFKERVAEGMSLLVKGSRFGTVVPLTLATISAVFGVFVSIYAVTLYILNGTSPEGWTTLMIVTGLGQASILALIGLTWSRIDSLLKGLSRPRDATAEVVVFPPVN
jgi:hypothetical protein